MTAKLTSLRTGELLYHTRNYANRRTLMQYGVRRWLISTEGIDAVRVTIVLNDGKEAPPFTYTLSTALDLAPLIQQLVHNGRR